jgi:sugar O-acyltransferase (sialic acid O-acetyltransferase NeuD family)
MKDLAIYGAGGFGREIACLINEINLKSTEKQWNLIGFFDDGKVIGTTNEYGIMLGGMNELNNYPKPLAIVLSIGKPSTMAYLVGRITNPLIEFPNIIVPDLRCLDKDNMSMGKGNVFFSKCSISCNVHIGDFNIFNGSISIGHDAIIGNFNTFMPGAKVSGEVIIGNTNLFGMYAVVLQQKKIGNNTVIGSGSIVLRNTQDNSTYVGNPACKLKF